MKSGKKLQKVLITTSPVQGESAFVEAIRVDGSSAKLSRTERKILASYKSKTYVEDIRKTFGCPDILADDFVVYKDGICKFTHTK